MISKLVRARQNSKIKKTEDLLTRIIRLTVGAGLLTGELMLNPFVS